MDLAIPGQESNNSVQAVTALKQNGHSVQIDKDEEDGEEALTNRLNELMNRYRERETLEDLEQAISILKRLVELFPQEGTRHARRVLRLGNLLNERFQWHHDPKDLHNAILMCREAVTTLPESSPSFSTALVCLGSTLKMRYKTLGNLTDLQEAVDITRKAVAAAPSQSQPMCVTNLSILLELLFHQNGDLKPLEEAIDLGRHTIESTFRDDIHYTELLNQLANTLEERFNRTGCLKDLDEAIHLAERAVAAEKGGNLNKWATNLANKLDQRYGQTRNLNYLNESIRLGKLSLQGRHQNDPGLAYNMYTLSLSLQSRYEAQGDFQDLSRAVELLQKAIDLTPEVSEELCKRLSLLGTCLQFRYERTGNLNDLEEAIRLSRQALTSRTINLEALPVAMHNLARQLVARFEQFRRLRDIEEAFRYSEQACESISTNSASYPVFLSNLSGMYALLYQQQGSVIHLREAIELSRRVIEVTPDDHKGYPVFLNHLASQLEDIFKIENQPEHLEEAIAAGREILRMTFNDDNNRAAWLNNHGCRLLERYRAYLDIADLNEAVDVLESGFHNQNGGSNNINISVSESSTAPGDIYLAGLLCNLGNALQLRSLQVNTLDAAIHEAQALSAYRRAWNCSNSLPLNRLLGAIKCVRILKNQKRYADGAAIAREALSLLPQTSTRALARLDQQRVIGYFAGLAVDACALRLECGNDQEEDIEEALSLLESGRGAMIGAMLDDRSDMAHLKSNFPEHRELFDKFEHLRFTLSKSASSRDDFETDPSTITKLSPFELLKQFNACVEEIRSATKDETFMRSITIEEMKNTAEDGAIVLVNVSDLRSDAIIVEKPSIRLVPLPNLKESKLRSWLDMKLTRLDDCTVEQEGKQNKEYRRFLGYLWRHCVRPILERIDHSRADRGVPQRRVWWCGTGIATSLPFHAAGIHRPGSEAMTLNRVVSSYVPTIKTLMRARRRKRRMDEHTLSGSTAQMTKKVEPKQQAHSMFLATMSTTDNAASLYGAEEEARAVRQILSPVLHISCKEQPHAMEILHGITQHDMFHFSGHGVSDRADPLSSCLLVEEDTVGDANGSAVIKHVGRQGRLTLSDLLETNVSAAATATTDDDDDATTAAALLAFLSACSTAENQVLRLADESMHLASGFMVAGFRHVVAALWPSLDTICTDIARVFYSSLVSRGSTVSPLAAATTVGAPVHYRNNVSDGEEALPLTQDRKDVDASDETFARALHEAVRAVYVYEQARPLSWAQYVHFGA